MRYLVTVSDQLLELDVQRNADGRYTVRNAEGAELSVSALANESGQLSLLVDGKNVSVLPTEHEVRFGQERYTVRAETALQHAAAQSFAAAGASSGQIFASMPGRIVRILCEVGAAVTVGTPLIVIEAMKMQNELSAKADGTVRAIHVSPNQTVDRQTLLLELE